MPILLVPAGYPQDVKDGGVLNETLGGLLPLSFGPDALELPRQPASV